MRFPRPATATVCAALVLAVAACASGGADPTATPSTASSPSPESTPQAAPRPTSQPRQAEADFPKVHPRFAQHFRSPLYRDEAGEFAPFGTDEGSDILYDLDERRRQLLPCADGRRVIAREVGAATLRQLEAGDPDEADPALDAAVIGAGFGLILITGRIDADGKGLILRALRRTQRYYDDVDTPELARMVRDLRSFPATSCGA